jgi:glycerol uptake facilitator protein
MFEKFLAEVFGTGMLIVLGDGVVAGVLLARSKAQNSGWIVITLGWGLAVMVAIYVAGPISGAHLNPAVTLGLASIGATPWSEVPVYLGGEFLGAFLGAVIVYFHYLPHWGLTEDPGLKLAVFSTGPAVRSTVSNLISEIIGTFILVFGVLAIGSGKVPTGLGALIVGLLVVAIGLSLGGPTGYAINPARDLGPRIAHFLLPIAGKGDSDWGYSWIPVVGPIIGGIIGALAYQYVFTDFALKAAGA